MAAQRKKKNGNKYAQPNSAIKQKTKGIKNCHVRIHKTKGGDKKQKINNET